jgi:CheY-like chemotaxis protein
MKKSLLAIAFLTAFFSQIPSEASACGDKFLVKHGTLAKARCMAGLKTGSILIYRDPTSKVAEKALGKDLERTLVNSGNTVVVAESREEFESALAKNDFDVVLTDYAAAQGAERSLKSAGKKARIVPVVEKDNESEVRSAKERFGSVIKDADRTSTKTLIINEVLVEAGNIS